MTILGCSRHTAGLRLSAIVLGLTLVVTGCDVTSFLGDNDDSNELSSAFNGLASVISLNHVQTQYLEGLSEKYSDIDTPGRLWYAAAELHAELTDEQLATLKQHLQERRQNQPPHNPRFQGPPHAHHQMLDRILSRLNLTDAQVEAINSIRDDYQAQLDALRQTCRSGDFGDSDAENWRELRSEMQDALLDVLTDEQRDKVAAWREKRDERLRAIRDARQEALELTEEQIEQFTERFADGPGLLGGQLGPCPRLNPEGPEASILTETQMEIVMIHKVLVRNDVSTRQQQLP